MALTDVEFLDPILLPAHDPTDDNHATRRAYVLAQVAAALASAEGYTDTAKANAIATAAADATTKANTAQSTAEAYTNTREAAITTAYQAADATNLSSANAYTDAAKALLQGEINAGLSGLTFKTRCRYAAIGNVADLANFPVAQDGITGIQGDTVFLGQQTNAVDNGCYVLGAVASGVAPLTRATTFNGSANGGEVRRGDVIDVAEGTAHGGNFFMVVTDKDPLVVGTDAINFTEIFAGKYFLADEVTLHLTGLTFSVKAGGIGSTQLAANAVTAGKIAAGALGAGLDLDANSKVEIAAGEVTSAMLSAGAAAANLGPGSITPQMKKTYTAKIGDAVATQFVITHNLGVQNVVATLKRRSDGKVMQATPFLTDANTITYNFLDAPLLNALEVFIDPVSAAAA